MARYTLTNGTVSIAVSTGGGELKSLIKNGREYMWQGDPAYWKRTAPVLFPLVGSLKDKQFRSHGKTWPMGQHGFARDMEFTLRTMTADSVTVALSSTEETLSRYPYPFDLEITYTISGNTVTTAWKVTNPGSEVLSFSLGGHPAFNCAPEGYSYCLYRGSEKAEELTYLLLNDKGLVVSEPHHAALKQGMLPITKALFEKDALICPDTGIHKVSIADEKGQEYLTVEFEADLLGLWSPAGKSAPFVCIEPWYGLADNAAFQGTWEERAYANRLQPGEVFTASYRITV